MVKKGCPADDFQHVDGMVNDGQHPDYKQALNLLDKQDAEFVLADN